MLMQGLPRLTIRQLDRLLSAGLISSEQLCSYCYALAIAGEDLWELNAFAHLESKENLLHQAKLSDERRRKGHALSALDGIPISIKGNIAVETKPLTAGSRILGAGRRDTPPVGYNADVSKVLLKECGAILMGMTNLDEFGMGSLGTLVVAGSASKEACLPTKNPLPFIHRLGKSTLNDEEVSNIIKMPTDDILEAHDRVCAEETLSFSAGGSSCGSAASVAHGSSILSVGTDTGGSVRLPAAWCGIMGLKPTYGLISRHGLVSYASSLDTPGILAPSADCVAIALDKLVEQESEYDSTLSRPPEQVTSYTLSNLLPDDEQSDRSLLSGMKVGIPSSFSVSECPSIVREAWSLAAERLEHLGASVNVVSSEVVSPEVLQRSLAAYYVLVSAEASSNLARYDGLRYGVAADAESIRWNGGNEDSDNQTQLTVLEQQYAATRTQGFGREVARRVLCGTSVLSSDRFHTFYEAAAKLRAVLTLQLHKALEDYDLLLVPTVVFPPVELNADIDQTEMFANDVMTVPISLSGLPAVSVPVNHRSPSNGSSDDSSRIFPLAMQLVGPRFGEATILRAAAALEHRIK